MLFNAVPLLVLAAAYFAVTAALVPALWRRAAREPRRPTSRSRADLPCVAIAAAILGGVVIHRRRAPIGGHVWPRSRRRSSRLVPAVLFVAALAGARRSRRPASRARGGRGVGARPRARGDGRLAVAALRAPTDARSAGADARSTGLELARRRVRSARARRSEDGARRAASSGWLAVAATLDWWPDVRSISANEPSGIASAVFEAAPVAVYDVGRPRREVSRRLVEAAGAKSGVFVPLVAGSG